MADPFMLLGYNTNGLAHHDPVDALALLAEIGYESVAITIDHHALSPYRPGLEQEIERVHEALARHGLRNVVETGARFLLDRHVKHEPTLMTADPQRRRERIDFYCRAIEVAAALGSDCVSLWSGTLRDDAGPDQAFARLNEGLKPVLDYAAKHSMKIGFEPEPGMFIDTMARYDRLTELIDAPHFCLTLDIGHLHCLGETPLDAYIRRYAEKLVNVHIEDMRRGIHEHLLFGEGEIDFPPVLEALADAGYQGGLHVELSRHSHDGPQAAARAFSFLRDALRSINHARRNSGGPAGF